MKYLSIYLSIFPDWYCNCFSGARSFHRKSLHHLGEEQNPYEQAISIIGRTLSKFDEDNLIPCFGFGDGTFSSMSFSVSLFQILAWTYNNLGYHFFTASTHDQEVFSFYPDERFCEGFEDVLRRYRELVPQLRLAGQSQFLLFLYWGPQTHKIALTWTVRAQMVFYFMFWNWFMLLIIIVFSSYISQGPHHLPPS